MLLTSLVFHFLPTGTFCPITLRPLLSLKPIRVWIRNNFQCLFRALSLLTPKVRFYTQDTWFTFQAPDALWWALDKERTFGPRWRVLGITGLEKHWAVALVGIGFVGSREWDRGLGGFVLLYLDLCGAQKRWMSSSWLCCESTDGEGESDALEQWITLSQHDLHRTFPWLEVQMLITQNLLVEESFAVI